MNTDNAYGEINHFANALNNWSQEYDQITSGRFDGRLADVESGSVRIFRETMNQSVAQHTHTPDHTISLLIPLSMQQQQCEDARGFANDAITLLPYNSEFFFVGPRQTDYLVIALNTHELQQRLGNSDYRQLLNQQQSQRIISGRADLKIICQTTLGFLNRLLTSQPMGNEEIRFEMLQKDIEHQLITLTCDLFSDQHRDWRPLPQQYRQLVKQCHELALSPEGSCATLLELSQWLGVPQRTLRYSFEKATGVSPNKYLRAARLNAARREIITSDLPIGSVAANYGFYHGGYFGQEYKRLFGETPRQTRKAG